jgi:hypothetical protein
MNLYVSLTSIFQRQQYLVKCLKSILNLNLKPNKCFIFLSENPYLIDEGFKNKIITNNHLKNIIDNNSIFEIKWVENIGPYRKLIPLLKEKWNENCLIFTFDDDVILHPDILSNYIYDYNRYKCCISYRGFNTNIKDINEFDYENFSIRIQNNKPNKFNFANSGVGMITHPSFFHKNNIILNKKKFLNLAPTADDLWYYICRIKNNIKTKIILNENKLFKLCYDKKTALFHNYNHDKNTSIFKNILSNI